MEYAIYNTNDEILFVGNQHECMKFLNCSLSSFYSRYSRFTKGIVKNPIYKIYKVED